jgi:hypothetical protein
MSANKRYWLDDPGNVTRLYRVLWAVGLLLLGADLLLHKHEDFAFAGWFAFYGVYGFCACVALVIAAKGLRRIVMRGEDYYDR